ncbi:MAG: SPFH domain-containing protein, partial [Planctomycetales bacterium]
MSDLASPLSALQLLAQPRGDGIAPVWYIAVAVFIAIFGLLIFIAQRYRRCPSNRVLVIYGRASGGQAAKCVHGGGRFVLPIVEDYDYLSLEPIQIGIPLKDALSMENIRVNVPSVFTVAIGTEPALMQNAAIRLLGLNNTQIHKQAEDIIFGQLRQVIASMPIQDINRDREQFLHNIQGSVEPELRKIGLVLINVNITDITDESGYIEAIGQKAASEAVQKARADVAEQMRIGETRIAETERDKFIQVAEADKVREIGIRQAGREKAVRVAELDKEQKVGEQKAVFEREMQVADVERAKRISVADANAIALVGEQKAAFQREMQVAEVDREKRIAVADANATAFAGEAGAQAKVADAQATLAVKKAEAYRIGETSKRQAEAAVLEAQNIAMAKAALAEAEKVEAERRAELEAPAKAEKARTIVQAEAEAAKRRLEAEGEAAAIFAKLEAEAKGQYEILAKKGEGLREIVSACGGAQQAFQLMMLEHLDNLAETAAKAISNIKFDKVIV